MHLLDLPIDLLVSDIVAKLPANSIVSCMLTCRSLQGAINDSLLLTYLRELAVAGMMDNVYCPYSAVPIVKRLAMLRERETRWLHLSPQFEAPVQIPDDITGHYDLAAGVYILGARAHIFAGSTPVKLKSLLLPSSNISAPPLWSTFAHVVGESIVDYTMALEDHDLVAYLTCSQTSPSFPKLHLIKHSTQLPHPSASNPVLQILDTPSPRVNPVLTADLEISGDYLGIVIELPRTPAMTTDNWRLSVWNWKTGQKKMDVSVGNGGIIFLREDIIMHPNVSKSSLDIYHITSQGGGPAVHKIRRLYLPKFKNILRTIRYRSHPNPYSLSNPFPASVSSRRPFTNDPMTSIIVLGCGFGTSTMSHNMIASRRRLLNEAVKALEEYAIDPTNDFAYHTCQWSDWGPSATRWLAFDYPVNTFVTVTAGSRLVCLTRDNVSAESAGVKSCRLDVFDFAEPRTTRARQQVAARQPIVTGHEVEFNIQTRAFVKLKDNPTLQGRDIFKEDVASHLPYIRSTYSVPEEDDSTSKASRQGGIRQALKSSFRETIRLASEPNITRLGWSSVMMDEERIIGVKARGIAYIPYEVDVMYFG